MILQACQMDVYAWITMTVNNYHGKTKKKGEKKIEKSNLRNLWIWYQKMDWKEIHAEWKKAGLVEGRIHKLIIHLFNYRINRS